MTKNDNDQEDGRDFIEFVTKGREANVIGDIAEWLESELNDRWRSMLSWFVPYANNSFVGKVHGKVLEFVKKNPPSHWPKVGFYQGLLWEDRKEWGHRNVVDMLHTLGIGEFYDFLKPGMVFKCLHTIQFDAVPGNPRTFTRIHPGDTLMFIRHEEAAFVVKGPSSRKAWAREAYDRYPVWLVTSGESGHSSTHTCHVRPYQVEPVVVPSVASVFKEREEDKEE